MGEFRSKVHEAWEGTKSLRTTVPSEVAAMLGIAKGDEILWTVEPGSLSGKVSKASPRRKTSKSR